MPSIYQERIATTTMSPIYVQEIVEKARARQRLMMDCACLEIEARESAHATS